MVLQTESEEVVRLLPERHGLPDKFIGSIHNFV